MNQPEILKKEALLRALKKKLGSDSARDGVQVISPADRRSPLRLSWSQHRMWFLEQLEDLGSAYHIEAVLHLKGRLDVQALQASLDDLLIRHEALRTVFIHREEDEEPVQRILPATGFDLKEHDLSDRHDEDRESALQIRLHEASQKRFDLERGPLIRAELFKCSEQLHVLFLSMHHIVSDGWSMGVLFNELSVLYGAYVQGKPNPLPALPIQYVDYAQWQRQNLTKEKLGEQLSFWQQGLQGAPTLLELPTDRPRPAVQRYVGTSLELGFGEKTSEALKALARRHGVTLFMVMQAGWSVLMGRLSGQDDVVIGTPVANRRRRELEGLIGFFVNTLALRTRIDPQQTVAELLQQVRDTTLAAYGHQDVPFEQVVEVLRPERSLGHSPIFQTMRKLRQTRKHPVGRRTLPHQADARTILQTKRKVIPHPPNRGGAASRSKTSHKKSPRVLAVSFQKRGLTPYRAWAFPILPFSSSAKDRVRKKTRRDFPLSDLRESSSTKCSKRFPFHAMQTATSRIS